MDWFRVDSGLPEHHKVRRLAYLLKAEPIQILGLLIRLFCWVARNREYGNLDGMWTCDIANSAGWHGDPDEFVNALVEAGWLDKDEDGVLSIHDWEDRQPLIRRRRNVNAKSTSRAQHGNATSTSSSRDDAVTVSPRARATDTQTDRQETPMSANTDDVMPIETGIKTYHDLCPSLPKVRRVTSGRRKKWKTRARDAGFAALFDEACRQLEASTFAKEGKWASFDWLIENDTNFVKAAEGKYADVAKQPAWWTGGGA